MYYTLTQGCGVGRFFRIPTPTPDSDSSSFKKPTPDSSTFENPTPIPAVLKNRFRLPTPTPAEKHATPTNSDSRLHNPALTRYI